MRLPAVQPMVLPTVLPSVLPMVNPVQHYAWGSSTAFAERFGWPVDEQPQAEIWMGAHPKAPSSVVLPGAEPSAVSLDQLLEDRPELAGASGQLPFLLKVLAAAQPLSIQTHPTAARAAAGFAAEEQAGVPQEAPERMYRDPHHKPELIVALEDFTALCGFRPLRESAEDLSALTRLLQAQGESEAAEVLTGLVEQLCVQVEPGTVLEQVVADVLGARRQEFCEVASALGRAVGALPEGQAPTSGVPESDASVPDASVPGVSAAVVDTVRRATTAFPEDPGVVVAVLLNRLDLSPGEALYLPAGNLHAYLHGLGVEVMASSDNVLRGGLTAKHVDVEELLEVTDCAVLPTPYCRPVAVQQTPVRQVSYRPDCAEFQLDRFDVPAEASSAAVASADVSSAATADHAESTVVMGALELPAAAVLLCTSGTVELSAAAGAEGSTPEPTQHTVRLRPGESGLLTAGAQVTLQGVPGSQAFLAQPGNP
ncbi:mannose-6-phosphate isomerase, class I [Nesterenkonia aerolata]|uniref:mannose-6-phosphate isomerase n=1 Tax=Nesterenkonia aerolata TaxID=3074079 RepID=A0ABU2DR31_9MICC|nr:mannose-6-phosphate isomerase, class I [Nesterenkonia sp. LY-0111]MDR8018876.1 mannose-6-phosphate isomerase, class I [Nesterenkonia sp. LY-0111]